MKYNIDIDIVKNIVTLKISERFTFNDSIKFPQLINELLNYNNMNILVDLIDLKYIDSTGLSLIIHINDTFLQTKRNIIVNENIGKLLKQVLFDKLYEISIV